MPYYIRTTEEQIGRALEMLSRKIGQLTLRVARTDPTNEKSCDAVYTAKYELMNTLDAIFRDIGYFEGLDRALLDNLAKVRVRYENMITDIVKQVRT